MDTREKENKKTIRGRLRAESQKAGAVLLQHFLGVGCLRPASRSREKFNTPTCNNSKSSALEGHCWASISLKDITPPDSVLR